MRARLIALWSVLALLALLTLYGVASALGGGPMGWDYGINALVMWWMTLCLAACCTVIAATHRRVMVIGIAAAVTLIVLLAFDVNDGPQWLLWGTWFGAACLAESGLLMLVKLRTLPARLLRLGTLASLLLFALALYPELSSLLNLSNPWDKWLERGVMALVICNAAGTLAIYLAAYIESLNQPAPESLPAQICLAATCPRCGASNTFPTGQSACQFCGLRVTLDIEEPRCACGYLLYKLHSANCPECGRIIRQHAGIAVRA